MIERRVIRFDHPALSGLELPSFAATGEADGPHVCLLAGIHGCEYPSIAAVIRFMSGPGARLLGGRVTAAPIVSVPSFRARSPFVMPEDGKNLNRCFPGDPDGTFSDVLAHFVFEELIAPSEVLLDLHGGDLVEALEPFALYDASPVDERARELAIAYGLPYIVRSAPEQAPISGTTSSAAAAAGIPAVIAEAGGCGLLEESAVRLHLDGLENVFRLLGMLPGEPRPPTADLRSVGRFVWLRSGEEGWWEPSVRPGQVVEAGAPLGTVRNLFGDEAQLVTAPEAGVVLFLTSSPAVAADGLLLGLGTDVMPITAAG
jgi:predicted deacylase